MANVQDYIKEKNGMVSYIKWLDMLYSEDSLTQEYITKVFDKIRNEIKLGRAKIKDNELYFTFLGEDGDVPYISLKRDSKGMVKELTYFIKPSEKTVVAFLGGGVVASEKNNMSRFPNHYKQLNELFMSQYLKDNKDKAVEYKGLVIAPYKEYSVLKGELMARDGYDILGDKILKGTNALRYYDLHFKKLGIQNINNLVFKVLGNSAKSKSRVGVGDLIVFERGELYKLNVH